MSEKMPIHIFFDPKNREHIIAFKYFSETGEWPKQFIKNLPNNISKETSSTDLNFIETKICNLYINLIEKFGLFSDVVTKLESIKC
jgi:hypothetical protein